MERCMWSGKLEELDGRTYFFRWRDMIRNREHGMDYGGSAILINYVMS